MNKWIIPTAVIVVAASLLIPYASLAHGSDLSQEEAAAENMKDHPYWISGLKAQHHLSETHIEFMKKRGLSYPQMAIISRISEASGKTVDDLLEMRSLRKMNWDQIVLELDIDPEESSSSIIAIREEISGSLKAERKHAMND